MAGYAACGVVLALLFTFLSRQAEAAAATGGTKGRKGP